MLNSCQNVIENLKGYLKSIRDLEVIDRRLYYFHTYNNIINL